MPNEKEFKNKEWFTVEDEFSSGEKFTSIYCNEEKEGNKLIANFYGSDHKGNAQMVANSKNNTGKLIESLGHIKKDKS